MILRILPKYGESPIVQIFFNNFSSQLFEELTLQLVWFYTNMAKKLKIIKISFEEHYRKEINYSYLMYWVKQ